MNTEFVNTVVFYLMITNFTLSSAVNVCTTNECRTAAQEIIERIDKSHIPCDNFYKFVCGNYIKNRAVTSTQLDLYDEMRNNTKTKLISILENFHTYDIITNSFRQISKLYNLCMDQKTLIGQGAKPLRDILNRLGGYPVLDGDQWRETGIDWVTIVSYFMEFGIPVDLFLKVTVTHSTHVIPYQRIISLDRPHRKYNLDPNSMDSVYNFYDESVENALKLGARRDNAERELMESRRLLIDLINLNLHTEIRTQSMKRHELLKKWPSVNWTRLFTTISSISSATPIDDNDFIIVDDSYIDELVQFMNETGSRVLMNYALSRAVNELLIYVRIENITQASSSRTELCFNMIGSHLPNALDALFALTYVDNDKRSEVINMIAAIQEEFITTIEHVDWLDNRTRRKAVEKLTSMSSAVGYVDEWKSHKWAEQYHDLDLDGKTFVHCILKIIQFKKSYRYRTGHNHNEDEQRLIQMNRMPYYRIYENKIVISAGFLQYIFLNDKFPKYMNYGRMGFFIGHEIAHIFDSIEELYKINQNLMESSKHKMLAEITCIINQYSNYTVHRINSKLNGNSSVLENIADNSGMKLAYSAYTNRIAQYGPEPGLPNLNYTSEQMFWINMAFPWCTNTHSNTLKDLINDSHSPAEFRIIGAVSNNDNFTRDFNCPVGSKMNPIMKCSVW